MAVTVEQVIPYIESWLNFIGYIGWYDVDESQVKLALTSSDEGKAIWEELNDLSKREFDRFIIDVMNECSLKETA